MSFPTNNPFTAFTGTNTVDTASFNSLMASLSSQFESTRTEDSTASTTSNAASSLSQQTSSSKSATPGSNSAASLSSTATTFATVTSGSQSAQSTASAHSSTSSGATSTGAATSSDGGLTKSETCNSISCSPGLQAAVAVPVVIGILGIIAAAFFFARRRKRRTRDLDGVIKNKSSKKWTRHLRVFSFDAELLMGGRFSSTNSTRSGNSLREGRTSQQGHDRSIHSVEEVAPPYRDAVSHAQPPSMTQTGAGIFAAGSAATDSHARPLSSGTAPPPYPSAISKTERSPTTPTSNHRNPFSDSTPVSPVEGSPFNDPHEDNEVTDRPNLSRNSSLHHNLQPDDGSTLAGGSDAGSIREAQVARNVSVTSGGRTIQNIRSSRNS